MTCRIKILAAALACMAASCAAKAPDAAAREEVRSLLAADFSELNAGRRTLVDVADHVADLAAASNSAARLRVLQEGAFNLYREAGALRFGELLSAVVDILSRFNVVAMDNVELSPSLDPSGRSTALACKFLREELLAHQ